MRDFLLAARADMAVPGKVGGEYPEGAGPALSWGDEDQRESDH
jgi:hypothetical protein